LSSSETIGADVSVDWKLIYVNPVICRSRLESAQCDYT
jgi:hypothetical protein